jgi:hypothetical protein
VAQALFGYSIESDFSLARARPAPNGRGTLEIRRATTDLLARSGEFVSWDEQDGLEFALATSGADLLASCSVTGTYLLRGAKRQIITQPAGATDHWEHRLGATIVPLLLAEHGDLALHAAAVVDRDRAIVFCGPPGRGKSTLTAALALTGRAVLSDDGVVISELEQTPLAWPGQLGVRIVPGALRALERGKDESGRQLGEKATHLMSAGESVTGASPVAAIVLLAPRGGPRVQVERVDPVAALPALIPHALHGGPDRMAHVLRLAALVVARVPVFRVRLPDRLGALRDQAEALLEALVTPTAAR